MIPKIIHKIILVDDGKIPYLPEGLSKAPESFYRQNPDYKVKIYSGEDCVNYIKENFDKEIDQEDSEISVDVDEFEYNHNF